MSVPRRADGDAYNELEELSERGTFWSPRDPSKQHPAKLVLKAQRWENITSKYHPDQSRPVLAGRDREGRLWLVPCDNLDLQPLHSGDVKAWNVEKHAFEVIANWGRTQPGETVAIEYVGDRSYLNSEGQQVTTGKFRVTRKPPEPAGTASGDGPTDDIPF
jgi:hypothetical protein